MGSIDTFPPSFLSTANAVLGYSPITTNVTGITTEVTITSVTVFVPAGRRIKVTAFWQAQSSVANDAFTMRIKEDGIQVEDCPQTLDQAAISNTFHGVVTLTPATGVHTYSATFQRFSGSGNGLVGAATTAPAFILVEDISGGTGGSGPLQLAYVEGTAQTGISTETSITSMSVTVSVPAGRRIKLSSQIQLASASTSGTSLLRIKEGATTLQVSQGNYNTIAGNGWALRTEIVITPTAGTHTYNVTVQGTAGTVDLNSVAGVVPYLLVEDITGTPSPAGIMPTSQTLAYAQVTANQSGITTEVDLTGLSVTVFVPDGRRIRVSGYVQPFTSVANDTFLARIYQDGAQVQQALVGMPITLTGYSLDISVELTPTAGMHTYKLTGFRNNGSGSESNLAAANTPSYILVEDITGGAPAVPPVNVPVGQLGYAAVTANQGSITTQTPITGLSVNVAVPAGRVLRVRAEMYFQNSGVNTGAGARMFILQDGVQVQQNDQRLTTASIPEKYGSEVVLSPSAGSHTYSVNADNNAGGTVTMVAGATFPAYIIVEDITPTPAAATGAPSSTLGYAETTTPQTIGAVGTDTDLTGLTTTVTVPAGRRIRIVGHTTLRTSVAGDKIVGYIKEGATYLGRWMQSDISQIGAYELGDGSVIITPSAGTHTYKLSVQRYSGTGVLDTDNNTDRPGFILVEDITGSVWPAGSQVTAGIVASEAWTDYTPALTGSTSNPVLGASSTAVGRFQKVGRTVNGWLKIKFGTSGTSFGSGNYQVSLPVAAATVAAGVTIIQGSGYLFDNSANTPFFIVPYQDNAFSSSVLQLIYTNATVTVTPTNPFTWANTDEVVIQFRYEAAS